MNGPSLPKERKLFQMVLEKQPGNQRAAVHYDNIVLPNIVTLFLLDLLSFLPPQYFLTLPEDPMSQREMPVSPEPSQTALPVPSAFGGWGY